jgi:uncharacterized protein (TIGR00730 family)
MVRSVTVFCGASDRGDPTHRAAAETLGGVLAGAGLRLVYGAGNVGLMGVLANAALQAGGEVVGVIPSFLRARELAHDGLSELIEVDSMHLRKQRMFELSDATLVLPGGLGTLDECIEVLTWKQLGLHDKPLLLIDVGGYWAPLLALIDAVVAGGYAHSDAKALYRVVHRVEDVPRALALLPEPHVVTDERRL